MPLNQTNLSDRPLKLVDKFTYLSNNITSTKSYAY